MHLLFKVHSVLHFRPDDLPGHPDQLLSLIFHLLPSRPFPWPGSGAEDLPQPTLLQSSKDMEHKDEILRFRNSHIKNSVVFLFQNLAFHFNIFKNLFKYLKK